MRWMRGVIQAQCSLSPSGASAYSHTQGRRKIAVEMPWLALSTWA